MLFLRSANDGKDRLRARITKKILFFTQIDRTVDRGK